MKQYSLLFLFTLNPISAQQSAQAPSPSGPTNITISAQQSAQSPTPSLLSKAGQFTTFIRLLGNTQVGSQIDTQLNNSNQGLTIFAPTDSAFSTLPAGALNTLTDQQKVELLQFHVLPTYLTTSQFQTISNPLRTQAGDSSNGRFPLNVTTSGNQVNLTTGVINTTVSNSIYTDGQLAVYQVDQVLLPLQLFGAAPVPAPAPAPSAKLNKKKPAAADDGDDDDTSQVNTSRGVSNSLAAVTLSICYCCITAFFIMLQLS